MKNLIFILILFSHSLIYAQGTWEWHDPLVQAGTSGIHGQAWEGIRYNRLPDEAENLVREPVWRLSRHSAGVKLRFSTDADQIKVRYKVHGNLDMPHMPATGVSGLDLYTKNEPGEWVWVKGNYSFKDTLQYEFTINEGQPLSGQYDLYLPLYNQVVYLEIGTPSGASFQFIPRELSAFPILVYGTSIAHGACASRPGMAWTAILERKLNLPLINLGFSGNGQLEEPLIHYMAQTKSKLYILDCLPNLVRDTFSKEEVKSRITKSVKYLKSKQPDIPILLVEHAGYSDEKVNDQRRAAYQSRNNWAKEAFADLLMEGFEEIYLLEKETIGLSMDATVDGTHPSDLGMQQYADAYYQLIKEIME